MGSGKGSSGPSGTGKGLGSSPGGSSFAGASMGGAAKPVNAANPSPLGSLAGKDMDPLTFYRLVTYEGTFSFGSRVGKSECLMRFVDGFPSYKSITYRGAWSQDLPSEDGELIREQGGLSLRGELGILEKQAKGVGPEGRRASMLARDVRAKLDLQEEEWRKTGWNPDAVVYDEGPTTNLESPVGRPGKLGGRAGAAKPKDVGLADFIGERKDVRVATRRRWEIRFAKIVAGPGQPRAVSSFRYLGGRGDAGVSSRKDQETPTKDPSATCPGDPINVMAKPIVPRKITPPNHLVQLLCTIVRATRGPDAYEVGRFPQANRDWKASVGGCGTTMDLPLSLTERNLIGDQYELSMRLRIPPPGGSGSGEEIGSRGTINLLGGEGGLVEERRRRWKLSASELEEERFGSEFYREMNKGTYKGFHADPDLVAVIFNEHEETDAGEDKTSPSAMRKMEKLEEEKSGKKAATKTPKRRTRKELKKMFSLFRRRDNFLNFKDIHHGVRQRPVLDKLDEDVLSWWTTYSVPNQEALHKYDYTSSPLNKREKLKTIELTEREQGVQGNHVDLTGRMREDRVNEAEANSPTVRRGTTSSSSTGGNTGEPEDPRDYWYNNFEDPKRPGQRRIRGGKSRKRNPILRESGVKPDSHQFRYLYESFLLTDPRWQLGKTWKGHESLEKFYQSQDWRVETGGDPEVYNDGPGGPEDGRWGGDFREDQEGTGMFSPPGRGFWDDQEIDLQATQDGEAHASQMDDKLVSQTTQDGEAHASQMDDKLVSGICPQATQDGEAHASQMDDKLVSSRRAFESNG